MASRRPAGGCRPPLSLASARRSVFAPELDPAAIRRDGSRIDLLQTSGLASCPSSHITRLLVAWGEGDQHARDALLDEVYDDLRRLAHHHLRRERPGHTLQTTALVHDAYLQLVDQRDVRWQNRTHFFAIASHLIRRILVEHARRRSADKRGGGAIRVALHPEMAASQPRDIALMAMDQALEALEKLDPQQSRVVELRFFGGLTVEETAEVLGISSRTVKRDWRMARAWLQRALETEGAT